MSDSFHVTSRDFKNCTNRELDEMSSDPESLLSKYSEKIALKRSIKKHRQAKPEFAKLDSDSGHNLIEEIEKLKRNIFSENWELVKSSADKLGKLGGDDITDFLISLLSEDNSGIRNRAALALERIGDSRAVEPLIDSIYKNPNYNGTMVFALESLDCSKHLKDIFTILFTESYEAKISSMAILYSQDFVFSSQDLLDINMMWDDCKLHPDKFPDIKNEKVKERIQKLVDGFNDKLK